MSVIVNFDAFEGDNPYAFLSNFWEQEVVVGDRSFPTGEHAFQAAKAATPADFELVAGAAGPGTAKYNGRRIALRRDWEEVKYDVMRVVLAHKFQGELFGLGHELLDTGDALLVEGTRWRDTVWGVDLDEGERLGYGGHLSPGRNWLGTLLMARRAELRSGVSLPLPDPAVVFSGAGL